MSEKEFRKWVVSNADKDWLLQPIETMTGSGVPDLFICHDGCSCWAELKESPSKSNCYMRISQWRWFNRLHSRGGWGVLMIKRSKDKRIDVYKMSDLLKFKVEDCILKGEDIFFPGDVVPSFYYKMGSGNKNFYKNLDKLLQEEFE